MNFFDDAQNVERIVDGGFVAASAGLLFWRQFVQERRIDAVRKLVAGNDDEILDQLRHIHKATDRLFTLVGDRRKAPAGTPPPSWADGGRRRSDRDP